MEGLNAEIERLRGRVNELLETNNRELERRRAAEASFEQALVEIELLRREMKRMRKTAEKEGL